MDTIQTVSSGHSIPSIYDMNNSISCGCMLYYIIKYRDACYPNHSINRYFFPFGYIHLFLILNYRENSNRTPCISFSSHPCDRGQSDFLTGISEALSSVSIQVTNDRSHLYFDYLELEFGIPKPLGYAIRKAILLHNQRIEVPRTSDACIFGLSDAVLQIKVLRISSQGGFRR